MEYDVTWVFEGRITGKARVTLPADERARREALDALVQKIISHPAADAVDVVGSATLGPIVPVHRWGA